MVRNNLPHLKCLFQQIDSRIRELETFLFHTSRVYDDLQEIWKEAFKEIPKLSDDQD